eukprot:TRINITY_DN6401_c0_g1_i2.p1 TRINITY_DN6401_c0_g1~~TRINITY_DN6401_c0_g1_i2.p1  ORF type:complete len:231 (+),score=35.98 TRINITY_DN6401_c0_g1_i2:68-694(+)
MASTTHSVTTLASSNDLDALLLSHPHVVLNFWASWCEPAKQMNNVVQELSKAYSNVTFVQIEAEQFPDVSEKYEVKAVPFYVFIQDKNVVDSVEGANPPEITRKSKALSEGKLAPAQPKPAATPVVSATPTATPSSTTDITARLVQLINQAPVVVRMLCCVGSTGCTDQTFVYYRIAIHERRAQRASMRVQFQDCKPSQRKPHQVRHI